MDKFAAVLALIGASIPLMLSRPVSPILYWVGMILAIAGMIGAFWFCPQDC